MDESCGPWWLYGTYSHRIMWYARTANPKETTTYHKFSLQYLYIYILKFINISVCKTAIQGQSYCYCLFLIVVQCCVLSVLFSVHCTMMLLVFPLSIAYCYSCHIVWIFILCHFHVHLIWPQENGKQQDGKTFYWHRHYGVSFTTVAHRASISRGYVFGGNIFGNRLDSVLLRGIDWNASPISVCMIRVYCQSRSHKFWDEVIHCNVIFIEACLIMSILWEEQALVLCHLVYKEDDAGLL